jgi:hypothetical protein
MGRVNSLISFYSLSIGRINSYWLSYAQSVSVSGTVGIYEYIFVLSKTFAYLERGLLFDERRGLIPPVRDITAGAN